VTHDRRPRLVEVLSQIIHLRPGRGVQAGIHTDAGAWLGGGL
jgi:hypothetical protein